MGLLLRLQTPFNLYLEHLQVRSRAFCDSRSCVIGLTLYKTAGWVGLGKEILTEKPDKPSSVRCRERTKKGKTGTGEWFPVNGPPNWALLFTPLVASQICRLSDSYLTQWKRSNKRREKTNRKAGIDPWDRKIKRIKILIINATIQ